MCAHVFVSARSSAQADTKSVRGASVRFWLDTKSGGGVCVCVCVCVCLGGGGSILLSLA